VQAALSRLPKSADNRAVRFITAYEAAATSVLVSPGRGGAVRHGLSRTIPK
jgi:hypothetical protein